MNLVFVHGLDGDAVTTWSSGRPPVFRWDKWITAERGDAAIYSLSYHVKSTGWSGGSMDLTDRAINVLSTMRYAFNTDLPTIYVVHSYGGLLVKAMLRKAMSPGGSDFLWFAKNAKTIVFFGTPHSGSRISNYVLAFGRISRSSNATRELKDNSAVLRDLNQWFREAYDELKIDVVNFVETLPTRGVMVVDQASADPGLSDCTPIPVDSDHLDLTKPETRDLRVSAVVDVVLRTQVADSKTRQNRLDSLLHEALQSSNEQLPYLKRIIEHELSLDPGNRTLLHALRFTEDSIAGASGKATNVRRMTDTNMGEPFEGIRADRVRGTQRRRNVVAVLLLLLAVGAYLNSQFFSPKTPEPTPTAQVPTQGSGN